MNNLAGTWVFTQKWHGVVPYKFKAEFSEEGTITINDGEFFGTYARLGNSSQVALAIANFSNKTITSYVGNVAGSAMGGETVGANYNQPERGVNGIWSAVQLPISNAEEKNHHVPEAQAVAG